MTDTNWQITYRNGERCSYGYGHDELAYAFASLAKRSGVPNYPITQAQKTLKENKSKIKQLTLVNLEHKPKYYQEPTNHKLLKKKI